jgi:hypothetical protein
MAFEYMKADEEPRLLEASLTVSNLGPQTLLLGPQPACFPNDPESTLPVGETITLSSAKLVYASPKTILGVTRSDESVEKILGNDPEGIFSNVTDRLNVADFWRAVNGMGVVQHGSNASVARPSAGFQSYIWIGTVEPVNWANNDIYLNTDP